MSTELILAAYSGAITLGLFLICYPKLHYGIKDLIQTYRDARERRMPDITEAEKDQMKAIWEKKETPGYKAPPTTTQLLDAVLHSVWLHGNWHFLTSKMTTEEKEAFADAVERYSARMNAEDGDLGDLDVGRWWRD